MREPVEEAVEEAVESAKLETEALQKCTKDLAKDGEKQPQKCIEIRCEELAFFFFSQNSLQFLAFTRLS